MVTEQQADDFRKMAYGAMTQTINEQLDRYPAEYVTTHIKAFGVELAIEYAQKQVDMLYESDKLISDANLRLAIEISKQVN